MKSLLESTRSINKQLQKYAGGSVDFNQIAQVLTNIIAANCFVLNRESSILGYSLVEGFTCWVLEEMINKPHSFPENYNLNLLETNESQSNVSQKEKLCVFDTNQKCDFSSRLVTAVPIAGSGKRLGTLLLVKFTSEFTYSDLVLAEYGATVVGMEILRAETEKIEEKMRKKAAVSSALSTLSYSELEAVEQIFDELNGSEGILVASKVADKAGITRSVIVNALRKFESAGVIETKSLGMKGTYIRVFNNNLLEELEKLKY